MTAEPAGRVMWSPDPVQRIGQDPVRVHAYDLVDGEYELVAESDTELVLSKPFEIRLPIRDITP